MALPLPTAKNWRLYFNRKDDFPIIWCVDEGSIGSQIRVNWIAAIGINIECGTDLISPTKHTPVVGGKRKENEPSAWFSVYAIAEFDNGGVTFYGPNY